MSKLGVALISLLNNEWSREKIYNGSSSVELVKEKVMKLGEINLWHFVSDAETDLSFYKKVFPDTSIIKTEIYSLLDECVKIFNECETVIFIYTDSPLTDMHVIDELLTLHNTELAEYSFTENYPLGIGAEILAYNTLKKLRNIASGNNEEFKRTSISRIINFDVNQYDVEVLVSDKDVRKERLELVCDNKRNYLICKNFLNHFMGKKIANKTEIYELIDTHPHYMRSVPAYIEIEITNSCNCECIICPRTHLMKREIQNMSLDKYKAIVNELKSFCDDISIAFTFMGEPTLHPKLFDMIEFTLKIPKITLIIETNGILLNKEMINRLAEFNNDKLIIIVALDSPNDELYQKLRSVNEFGNVENNVSVLLEKMPKNSYIQILRLKENDEYLDAFYTRWHAYKDQIILQKYNDYKNQLEDRKGADLSPLKRFSCWHLKRDMIILVDGTVAFCKQDINGIFSFGNVFTDGVKTAWDNLESAFVEDHKGNVKSFCENCDEWFTYNF
ncbi:MAG: spiro-SPASM protein [Spirochaetota bacterium]|nr:spiro-SPASM protein [Spirochaetota bacterium]